MGSFIFSILFLSFWDFFFFMALVIVREGQERTTQSDPETCESVKKITLES